MHFGALGDIHGDFTSARRTMERHPEVPFWICVGDVADDQGRYEPLPAPLYWIKGNNENFDSIAAGELPDSLHYLPNGVAADIDGIRVAGLGGTFAPSSQAPEALATLSLLTPHGWFLRGLGDMQGTGSTAADCLPAVAVLLTMGIVTGGLGMLRARRLVAPR